MNARNLEAKQIVITEFEMGSAASLVPLLENAKTKKEFSQILTQLNNFLRSSFVIRSMPYVLFKLISVVRVTEVAYPCEVSYVIYYQEL